ncbi:STAS domain-containing protein [Candidatus Methanoprimaticola sp. MG2]|uniref:STAS domain-containing protein n=1 Tax=Candidatus Methanoprimaticola sp. MG2 TaxID=3228838 RepID=UPI0039C6E167
MDIIENMNGRDLTLKLTGRLDTNTAPELDARIRNMAGMDSLTFDMSELEYISSAGLRVILSTHKVMSKQGGMRIINVRDTVMEVFEATGFTDVMDIE